MDPKIENKQTVNVPDLASGMGELAQRAAVKPWVEELRSPDGVESEVAFIPTVDATGRITVRMESVAPFYEPYLTQPKRRRGTANLGDLDSLIAHVNRFKDMDSVVFVNTDRDSPTITALLDYHRAGSAGSPRFGTHRSRYDFPVSSEWEAWTRVCGQEMSQAAFAEFIEAHIIDVVDYSKDFVSASIFAEKCGLTFASTAQILELSRGLSINVESKFATGINLQNGIKQIQFSESHVGENGTLLKVPGAFLIGIPVFKAETGYTVCVRLRYRKQGASLTWFMELWRHDEVFNAAIRDACNKVAKATELPLLVGTPE
jgi:uncharacterized protein YfdQ (DUF2303 family)